jgi:MOSC domain-containing protein YiiM
VGSVVSVNVGAVRTLDFDDGHVVTTGIWKEPVQGRRAVGPIQIAGDDQADRSVHGGPDKAVYVYALEDLEYWAAELSQPVTLGLVGENLTTRGVAVTGAVVGERWRIGSALFEVAQPRVPCFKLAIRLGDRHFPRRFAAAGRPGAYLRVIEVGEVGAGDAVEVVSQPGHGLTVGDVARIYHHDRGEAPRLTGVAELPPEWRQWAAARAA